MNEVKKQEIINKLNEITFQDIEDFLQGRLIKYRDFNCFSFQYVKKTSIYKSFEYLCINRKYIRNKKTKVFPFIMREYDGRNVLSNNIIRKFIKKYDKTNANSEKQFMKLFMQIYKGYIGFNQTGFDQDTISISKYWGRNEFSKDKHAAFVDILNKKRELEMELEKINKQFNRIQSHQTMRKRLYGNN